MCASSSKRQHGLTLIELIVFIVVVGVGVAGILVVMNTVVKSSADPMVRKQTFAMGDAILEEILAKDYSDPDGTSGETSRITMDDVSDYAYFDGSSSATRILGSQLLGGSTSPLPDTYWASVAVSDVTVSGQVMRLVEVSVHNPQNETYTLRGYRGNL